MKKLILSIALCCAVAGGYAQEATDPTQLLNDGKTALEAKNYQEAFDKLSAYLTQTNNQDSVIAFNCGVCADKIKQPAEAVKYFDIAIQKNYNLANSYIGKVGALKDLQKNDEYVAALKAAMEAVPEKKADFCAGRDGRGCDQKRGSERCAAGRYHNDTDRGGVGNGKENTHLHRLSDGMRADCRTGKRRSYGNLRIYL